jgi:iron complex outermembrane receptor protein
MGDLLFRKSVLLGALALGVSLSPVHAQSVDEVIVTGSYIKQSAEDAPVPVDVINNEELFNLGSPSVVELIKTLGVSSGVDGETNQFQSNGLEGTANVNLRGLGAGRNLVLLNGRRNVFSPYPISEQQQLFVDINMIPGVAIDRVELLKDGAAATYGSDAISGVVNFITRNDFEGYEVALSHKDIDGSDGDQDLGLIWGKNFGKTHVMASFGYNKRNKLQARSRDWAVQNYGYKGNNKGYTGIPNPGSYFPVELDDANDIIRTRRPRVDIPATTDVDESKRYVVYQLDANNNYVMDGGNPVPTTTTLAGHQLIKATKDDPETFEQLTGDELRAMGVNPDADAINLTVAQTTGDNPVDLENLYTIDPVRDERCEDFVGASAQTRGSTHCTYNYVYYDNLIEEEERYNFFATLTHDFSDDMRLSAELLWGNNEVPEWNTSPSYPPQVLVDTNINTGRIIPSYHPGLLAYANLYGDQSNANKEVPGQPELQLSEIADENCTVTGRDDPSCAGLLFFGRPFGVSGPPNVGYREHETLKLSIGLEGTFENEIDYTTSFIFSESEGKRASPDTYIERWSAALKGFGGPDCAADETTPGANGCLYYNPFSNSIQNPDYKYTSLAVNPDYDPAIAFHDGEENGIVNTKELRDWMQYDLGSTVTSELTVAEAVFSGEADIGVGWAVGAQLRNESYKIDVFEGNDLHVNPCITDAENTRWGELNDVSALCDRGTPADTSDDYEGSGQFGFLAGATPFDDDQDIFALFGEVAIPFTENFDAQLSMRFEDYGGTVGDSFDPKVALRYQASDAMVIRGSASTTFRGPTLNQLGGRSTTLSFVGPTGSFKAIDTFGNADLEPETATTTNLGVIYDYEPNWAASDSLTFSADYWSFDFQNPIIKQSFTDIISQSFGADGYIGGPYGDQISCGFGADSSCEGKKTSSIERIKVNMINGPDIETDGFDIRFDYDRQLGMGDLSLGAQLTLVTSYDVGSSDLNDSFDALGKLNDTISYLRPVIEEKWQLNSGYSLEAHTFNAVLNLTGSYQDSVDATAGSPLRDVEEHTTLDLHYNLNLGSMNQDLAESAVWVSIYNATDEDPPFARLDLNYDPYTHNPFGRIIKVGVRHKF